MSDISVQTRQDDLTEHEFTPSCENGDCGAESVWKVWMDHAKAACGISVHLCDRCKQIGEWIYTRALEGGGVCPACHETIHPPLSNVFKATAIR